MKQTNFRQQFTDVADACARNRREPLFLFRIQGSPRGNPRQLPFGKPDAGSAHGKSGLGTGIVEALSNQLDAKVDVLADSDGTTVSITHATFVTTAIRAA